MRRSLLASLMCLFGIATILPVASVGMVALYYGQRGVARKGTELAGERAQRIALQVGAAFHEEIESAQAALGAADLSAGIDGSRRALGGLVKIPEILGISLVGERGDILPGLEARADQAPSAPAPKLPSLADMQSDGALLLGADRSGPSGMAVAHLAFALPRGKGPAAHAIVDLQLDDLETVLVAGRSSAGSRIFLADRDGKVLLPSSGAATVAEIERGSELLAMSRWVDEQHPLDTRVLDGADGALWAAAAAVPGTNWRLLTVQPGEELFPLLGRFRTGLTLAFAGAVLLALALAYAIARRGENLVKDFTEAALKIAGGQFGVQVGYRGKNELGRLAQVFDYMSQQLQAYDAETRGLYKNLEEGYLQTMLALSNVIDSKDAYTHGHSRRVAELAAEVGREMHLPEHDVKHLLYGGLLHDLGKIGVVEPILLKKSQLTEDEMKAMKEHPEIGATIIAQVDFLKPIIPAVRNHHERWDGRGYPDGMAGEAIPLMARIVGAADTWDACTSHRTYQRAMTFERALEVMRNLSGRQLDPKVGAALEAVVRRRKESGAKVSEGDEPQAPVPVQQQPAEQKQLP